MDEKITNSKEKIMDYSKLGSLAAYALGQEKAPLVIKNARVINVFTEEILAQDIAIADGLIVGVGEYDGVEEIDLGGKYVAPGFVDAHLHFESTLVTPPELVQTALGFGTTTFIVDPHEVTNVAGTAGIDYILDQIAGLDANVRVMLPSCVPATPGEENGATFTAVEMAPYLEHPQVLGLGEVMDFVSVTTGEAAMVDKLALFDGRPKDGHAPLLTDKQLAAYTLAKIISDHEGMSYDYVIKEVRGGMYAWIREGSGERNLDDIVTGIVAAGMDTSRFGFCTDDKHIDDIQTEGHISYNIRRSIELGLDPIKAIKMATINPATCYGLTDTGAIAPGYRADLVVLEDLEKVNIDSVYCLGKPVDPDEKIRIKPAAQGLKATMNIAPVSLADIQLAVTDEATPVIAIVPGQIATLRKDHAVPQRDGLFIPDETFNKILVVERHKATGHVGVGVTIGFNITGGAIATSVSHDSHNIIVVGDNDADILAAIYAIEERQGGYVIVQGGQVTGELPLPVMGLISEAGYEKVDAVLSEMIERSHTIGVPRNVNPFSTLSFMALPVIPELRITTKGMYDVGGQKLV